MATCRRCGIELPPGSESCPACGESLWASGSPKRMAFWVTVALVLCVVVARLGLFVLLRAPILIVQLQESYASAHIDTSDAYSQGLEIAKADLRMQGLLGGEIRADGRPQGRMTLRNGRSFTEWSVKLAGANGHGVLCEVANESDDQWRLSRLAFHANDGREIDLTPAPIREKGLPPSAGEIFLVPLDLPAGLKLDWAPAYFDKKLGVAVKVLPPVALDAGAVNQTRHQAIAEELVDRMLRAFPEVAHNPRNVFLGVTGQPMYIRSFAWNYSTAYRVDGRYGVISAKEIESPIDSRNPELMQSRLRKMILKNVEVLALRLPMNSEPTSALSWPVSSGSDVDEMTEEIYVADRQILPWQDGDDACVSVTRVSAYLPDRRTTCHGDLPQAPETLVSEVDLSLGLVTLYYEDFDFEKEVPFDFVRASRPQDNRSRGFGIGANDSLDVFLVGDMDSFTDLIGENGGKVHFARDRFSIGQKYSATAGTTSVWYRARLIYDNGMWVLRRGDGWKYYFPYRPDWSGVHVTILTGMVGPDGKKIEMVRNKTGDLQQVRFPSGRTLDFSRDTGGRIVKIEDSKGRSMAYEYDSSQRLIRVSDIRGPMESFEYDDRNQMLSVRDGAGKILISYEYSRDGDITSQTLGNGEKLTYEYDRASASRIRRVRFNSPAGFESQYLINDGSYFESFPFQLTSKPRQ